MIEPKNKNKTEVAIALPLANCLAKTYQHPSDDKKSAGRLVLNHCEIVGSVARELIARMPEWLQCDLFPVGSELVAGAHDIGKVSPTFQEKIYRGTTGYRFNSISGLENINPELEKQWGGHAGISQVMARDSKFGKLIPEIVGQHHGYSPPIAGRCAQDQVFGGVAWHDRREELVIALKESLGCDWPTIVSTLQARVISGLTTVSDWIGSGEFFEDPQVDWKPNINRALDDAGFISPKLQAGLSFTEIFGFDARDAQKKLFENCIQPGIYILEAPMGLGKTEAALYAAYLAMAADKAKGFYFALPTQLTSDKIHFRVNKFLQKILAPDCRHRQALLLHGNAWLNASEMGEDGKPGGSWFNSSKRGILAPFAVGTIDQALMAVMNVKHGFVRTFGLAGKVVILDEVHSYDAYTGTILNKLVSALRELHCTVIILSATLTKDRRQSFLQQETTSNDYPLISALPNGEKLNEVMVEPITDMQVTIHHCQQDSDAIDEVLLRAEQGQQVLWIENTVAEAQDRYKFLADRAKSLGVAIGLLHSRYTKEDRDFNEQRWVRLYGKDGAEERQQQGRILVGTQVLEQSLDIDADFLVTRICPTDMLLQRIGRLWRHSETVRHSEALREAWLLEPLLAEAFEDAKKVFGKTAKVYSPYVLCRSLEIWSALSCVVIPGQIRELLEATYVERAEAEKMARHKEEMAKEIEKLGRLALVGLSQGGKTLPEHKASTRYNEQETVDVLLIRSHRPSSDKLGTNVVLLSGEPLFLPRNCKAQNRQRWRELAAILQKNIVKVATYQAPDDVNKNTLSWLQDYLYLGDKEQSESLLRVAVVADSDELKSIDSGDASSSRQLSYDALLGYRAIKK